MASAEERKAAALAKAEESEGQKKKALRLAKQKAEQALKHRSQLPAVANAVAAPLVGAAGGYSAGYLAGRFGSAQNPHWPAFVKGTVETVVGIGASAMGHPTVGEQVANLAAGTWGSITGESGFRHGSEARSKAAASAPAK